MRAVVPVLSTKSGSAPASRSKRAMSTWPLRFATISAVVPCFLKDHAGPKLEQIPHALMISTQMCAYIHIHRHIHMHIHIYVYIFT